MLKKTLIKATELNRYFGGYHAVNDFNLELKQGEVLGLLGPNGAGKSTTMQMLTGNLAPGSGEIVINDIDLLDNPKEAKSHIGYLPERPPVYRDMTVAEYLRFCTKINDVEAGSSKKSIEYALERCGLTQVSKRLIGNLSKGYQQRTGIAQAILHNPAIVILDEPTVGLDPIQIKEIRELIRDLGNDHGVILSTHILPEVQAVCDRVQIIFKGRTVFNDSLSTFSGNDNSNRHQLVLQVQKVGGYINDEAWHVIFESINGVESVETTNFTPEAITIDPYRQLETIDFKMTVDKSIQADVVGQVCNAALHNNFNILSIKEVETTLESVFVELIHKEEAE